MKVEKFFENWLAYEKDILNEVYPTTQVSQASLNTGKKQKSAAKQRVVKGDDPDAPPVNISGIPGGEDEEYGAAVDTIQARDAQRQKFKRGEAAEAAGHLYSDEDLDDAQLAGEIGLIPAEAAMASGLAGAKAAAYASPAAAALAAGEAGVAAVESPYVARPGEQQHYRTGSDKKLASYFRSRRIKRKTDPNLQSKASLLKDLKNVKKYIQKTASGNIIIRGGGDYLGKAADEAKLSGLLASEIKANFLDIRKRLLALKKKPSTVSPEVREKLIAQAKKLGVDPEKYIANAPGERRRKMAAALAGLQEDRKMKITRSQLRKLIKEVRALGRLDDIIKRVFPDGVRGARHLKMSTPDAELIADMLRTGEVEFGDLPWEIRSKWREAGGRMPDDLPGKVPGVSKDAGPVSEPTVIPPEGASDLARRQQARSQRGAPRPGASASTARIGGHAPALDKNGELLGTWVDDGGRAFVTLATEGTPGGKTTFMYSSGTSYLMKSADGFLEGTPRMWIPVKEFDMGHYVKFQPGDPGFGQGRPELWNSLYNVTDKRWDAYFSREYGNNWPQLLADPANERKYPKLFDDLTTAIEGGAIKKQPPVRHLDGSPNYGKYPELGSKLDRIGKELTKFSPNGNVTDELVQAFGPVKSNIDYNTWRRGGPDDPVGARRGTFEAPVAAINPTDATAQRGTFPGVQVRESVQHKKLKIILG
jgi:hypothetical protein